MRYCPFSQLVGQHLPCHLQQGPCPLLRGGHTDCKRRVRTVRAPKQCISRMHFAWGSDSNRQRSQSSLQKQSLWLPLVHLI